MKGHFGGRRNLYYERTFHYEKFFLEKESSTLKKNIRENNILHKKGEKKKDSFIRKRELYY